VYTLANPTAAAYQYLESYPTTAPPGEPLNQQLAAIEISVVLRARLFTDNPEPLGTVSKENVDAALSFVGGNPQSINTSTTYSNSLVSYANKFNPAAIKQAAKNFKVPGLNAPVKLPAFPAGTP
jgi:hypothetical protein